MKWFKDLFKKKPKCEHDFKYGTVFCETTAITGWVCVKCGNFPNLGEMMKLRKRKLEE